MLRTGQGETRHRNQFFPRFNRQFHICQDHQAGLFDSATENLALEGGNVVIHRGYFETTDADRYFEELLAEVNWSQEEVFLYGKIHPIPRLTAWYGDPFHTYTYSGIEMRPEAWTPLLAEIRDRTAEVAEATFNSLLLNLYRTGLDHVAWHADDEPELGSNPVIGSVSLGATRRFHLRPKTKSAETVLIDLRHGDVLVMSGPTQQCWLHQLPKTQKPIGARINLTFRTVHAGMEPAQENP